METISASKFKATCLAVLDRVGKTGEKVLITKRGKVIAQLTPPPVSEGGGKWLGYGKGTGKIVGDITGPATDPGDWGVLKP